jgi:hypothetical protein
LRLVVATNPTTESKLTAGAMPAVFLLPFAQFLVFGSQLTFPHNRRQALSAVFCVFSPRRSANGSANSAYATDPMVFIFKQNPCE